jgi:hypothetical protein
VTEAETLGSVGALVAAVGREEDIAGAELAGVGSRP